jgi:predicted transcriptional regulator
MLDHATRAAVLTLKERGLGARQIARVLRISRGAVRKVLSSGTPDVPPLPRASKADPHKEQIIELLARCKGNLVRVHEELVAQGASISYPALTAFCRRERIGHAPPLPAGHYGPGQEMQHDTSPHRAMIAGGEQRIETASLVLCYSRMLFFQCYPSFNRFRCKVFLSDALTYLQGVASVCMIDNTHVVVASGSGADMAPAPEMAAFAERFGFVFRAHEKGDANRSARVERPFRFIEGNFLAGRSFADFDDLNRQARDFCDRSNAKPRRLLHGSPRELFAAERDHLRGLPLFIPEVYALHHRIVDVEGYVSLDRHRYSVPYALIGRQLELRETKDRLDAYLGPRLVASHRKITGRAVLRVTLPEHRPPRGQMAQRTRVEEQQLLEMGSPLQEYAAALKKHSAGRGTLALRRLLAIYRDYPKDALTKAVATALQYGLFDLGRLERLILRTIAKDYFVLPGGATKEDDDE